MCYLSYFQCFDNKCIYCSTFLFFFKYIFLSIIFIFKNILLKSMCFLIGWTLFHVFVLFCSKSEEQCDWKTFHNVICHNPLRENFPQSGSEQAYLWWCPWPVQLLWLWVAPTYAHSQRNTPRTTCAAVCHDHRLFQRQSKDTKISQ